MFAVASFHAVFLGESACDVAPFGEATGLEDVLEESVLFGGPGALLHYINIEGAVPIKYKIRSSLQQAQQSRSPTALHSNGKQVCIELARTGWRGRRMDEVAAVSVWTKSLLNETSTNLGLVLTVSLVVLFELLQAVCELAAFLIGTIALLYEFFAELRLLFM